MIEMRDSTRKTVINPFSYRLVIGPEQIQMRDMVPGGVNEIRRGADVPVVRGGKPKLLEMHDTIPILIQTHMFYA